MITPPQGLDSIIATFGSLDDPNFERDNIVSFVLPYTLIYNGNLEHTSRCHKLMVEPFQLVLSDIYTAGLSSQVKNYGGIYARRSIRGQSSHPSTHSWGIAIDLEPLVYPLGSTARFPQPIIDIFVARGFMNGADFKSRKDPMHYQFASGY